MKHASGSQMQGGLVHQKADYKHENIPYPMVGVVLEVFSSDHPANVVAQATQDRRGSAMQARVLIVRDGAEAPLILPHVMIMPPSGSGADDYSEELPKPTTGTTDGSEYRSDLYGIPPNKLNGDWCVVQFIGGSIHQPVMMGWFPHPANTRDPLTSQGLTGNLIQNRRYAKRIQGTTVAVTSKGSVFLDTSNANQPLNTHKTARETSPIGGDIRLTVKQDKEFEVNFNPPVFEVNADRSPVEPDLLHEFKIPQTRKATATSLLMSEDFINAVAGKVVNMQASENIYFGGDTASENFVLGQELKTLLQDILTALITHVHPTSFGPSGPGSTTQELTDALSSVNLNEQLSDWIFGTKDPG